MKYPAVIFPITVIIAISIGLAGLTPAAAVQNNLPEHLVKLQDQLIIEAGKAEELIYRRGAVYENKEIERYLDGVAGSLLSKTGAASETAVRIRIIRDPTVNAFALPNGSIYVHTGTLARLQSEAQLAFMLSHEISHVIHSDSAYHTHSYHNKVTSFKVFDILLTPTSVFFGILGDLAQLGSGLLHISAITGYSREIEARADKDGTMWAADDGYDPKEAAGLINIFLAEQEKYMKGAEIFFLMDHPSNKWRKEQIQKIISEKYSQSSEGKVRSSEFLNSMTTIKLYNATLNIKMERLEHAKDNLQWILENFPNNPEAHYLAGEILRTEAEDKKKLKYELNSKKWHELNKGQKEGTLEAVWLDEAENEYKKAVSADPSYANSYKGIGLLKYKAGNAEGALVYFTKYLEIEPNAGDKRYMSSMIKRILEQNNGKKERGS